MRTRAATRRRTAADICSPTTRRTKVHDIYLSIYLSIYLFMYCADIEQRDWKVRSIHHRSNPYQATWSSTERIATESHVEVQETGNDELQDDLWVFNRLKDHSAGLVSGHCFTKGHSAVFGCLYLVIVSIKAYVGVDWSVFNKHWTTIPMNTS